MNNNVRFHGAMRPTNPRFHRTSTGIAIGSAHTQLPPTQSADAEKIQAALLAKRTLRKVRRAALAIHTDNSLRARLIRWVRAALLALRSPRL